MLETPEKSERQPITVSDYLKLLNSVLENYPARITGEVSECKPPSAKGHVYFTLKDKEDNAVIDCIIWDSNYERCGLGLKVGMEIIATGVPDIYAPWGKFTFKAQTVELIGEGPLKKSYDALKKKLEEEGLFRPERKRPLPAYPKTIGVLTSREGAVIKDFLANIGQHGFIIRLIHSNVEGQEAIHPLLEGMALFRKEEIDILVVMRGGGSLESLQAFNNELLVREVTSFPVPVIAAIGHEKDVTLAALAADHAPSTASIAAKLVAKSWEELPAALREHKYRIMQSFKNILDDAKREIESAQTLPRLFLQACRAVRERLASLERIIAGNDPRRQLRLGFSIARHGGKIIRRISDVKTGSALRTQVADGVIASTVETTHPHAEED